MSADVIEHVSNCELFIKKIYEHLLPDGTFLVSTPNPFSLIIFDITLLFGLIGGAMEAKEVFFITDKRQIGSREKESVS